MAMGPGAGGQVGTITATNDAQVSRSGGGTIESHLGAQEMTTQYNRLERLRTAEQTLTRFENFLETDASP